MNVLRHTGLLLLCEAVRGWSLRAKKSPLPEIASASYLVRVIGKVTNVTRPGVSTPTFSNHDETHSENQKLPS